MNDDLLMNDTFDDFAFTQTEEFLARAKSKDFNVLSTPVDGSTCPQKGNDVRKQDEISLDDSHFLTESFSCSYETSTGKEKKIIHNGQLSLKSSKTFSPEEVPKISQHKENELLTISTNGSTDTARIKRFNLNSTRNKHIETHTVNKKTLSSIENLVSTKANLVKDLPKTPIIENLVKNDHGKKEKLRKCVANTSKINIKSNNSNKPTQYEVKKDKIVNDQAIRALSSWGLPEAVLEKYESKNVKTMFQWQVECLSIPEVLNNQKNLVYSAPTSAGKTLVAEILAIKTILERHKKVIFILPFVSIVREKMYYFQDILGSSGIRVEGFMGSYNPPGGFSSVQLAICTIEKANSLINRLLEEKNLSEIGAILVDEVHLLGDPSRGYLLELLLTKLRYVSKKDQNINIQIIGMSATLPNLNQLAKWLDAELYTTDFRPIPLHEQAHVCGEIYDKNLKLVRKLLPLSELGTDSDNILQLCLETIKDSCSVLIFCPTKNWCENLAQQISSAFCKVGNSKTEWGVLLRTQLNTNLIMELLEQLKYCPVGLDDVLRKTVSFGVAFHHAGLTMDERDIIEAAFRNGALRILVATSTLSSGVNLPARRVIIRTPNFHGKPIDTLTYRQMIGRAGRMGKDSVGESVLICQKNDYKLAKDLMSAELTSVRSCLDGAGKLKRAILEVIASGVASSPDDVNLFTSCTLLAVEDECSEDLSNPIDDAVKFLKDNEFIRLQKQDDGSEQFVATSLGKACLSSSIAPDEGLALFTELERARQCFVLETELHLIYLVTPYNACHSWGNLDWMFYLELWAKLPSNMKRVGELVGVRESYIVNATRGKIPTNTNKLYHKLLVHKRFFVALALQDLVNEKPLGWVCAKFSCNRGMLQSLQQSASSFAGMVTAFSRQLGWSSVELLISQFQDRMQFGVSRDLLDLMHLPILNGKMARTLYNAGVESVIQLANSSVSVIESILHRVAPFETDKEREGESEFDKKQRNKFRNVWVTGKEGLTEQEAAEMLVADARKYLQLEMGLADAKWETRHTSDDSKSSDESFAGENRARPVTETPEDVKQNCVLLDTNESPIRSLNLNNSEDSPILETNNHNIFPVVEEKISIENSNSNDSSMFSKKLDISSSSAGSSGDNFVHIEDTEDIVFIDNNNVQNNKTNMINSNSINILTDEKLEKIQGRSQRTYFSNNLNSESDDPFKSSSSFSDINLTDIERQLMKNFNKENSISPKKTNKIPIVSNRNEVSQLLQSSPIELNISGSSIFSPKSNLNISLDKMLSDQSLFGESFTLQLSESEEDSLKKDSGVKELNIVNNNLVTLDSITFLENAFSESFTSDLQVKNSSSEDIFSTSSDEEEICGSSRKRKNKDFEADTPSKKLKTKQETAISAELNTSCVVNRPALDFVKIEIVNVCTEKSLLDMFCKEIKQQKCFALSLACSKMAETRPVIGINLMKKETEEVEQIKFSHKNRALNGFSICWGSNVVYYVSLDNIKYNGKIAKMLKSVVGNKSLRVRMFDAKEQIKVLKYCCDINFQSELDDPKVADWILEPEDKEKNLQAMAVKYCPEAVQLSQLSGGCKGVGSVGLDLYSTVDPKTRAAIEAFLTWHLVDSLRNKLIETKTNYLEAYNLEMCTVACLARIELNGISVSKQLLQNLTDVLKNQIMAIEKRAFSLAGRHFNFVSSVDVAKVIGMFKGRKVSTRKQILEQNEHPISDLVLQWRKINSTLTKMIYPLIRITKNERIYGCYIMHTATGRITMHEPNLQNTTKNFSVINPLTKENVPINCRSAFVVPDGYQLVSADYCQLELRILTHLSQDKLLCRIMKKPGDVFKHIAAKWNRVEEDKVDDSMRQGTKNLCYGIIYGMGSRTLADQLDISENEATKFMDTFRNTYPGLKTFIKETVDGCRKNGYVETITGRRRYLPNIKETDNAKRGQAERQAVNTAVQGSAADISKKAMVMVENELHQVFCKSKNIPKLVLHLHDELIYDVPTKYVRKVARIIKKNMEKSVQLSVPFPVKLKTGKSWGEMIEYTVSNL